jgi:hypothetical protein
MSIKGQMDEEDEVYINNGILFSHKKHDNMDEYDGRNHIK